MKKILTQVAIATGVVLLFLLFFAAGTGTIKDTPPNAIMFLDDEARTYLSPPCASRRGNLRQARAVDASAMKYKPDKDCANQDGFLQKGRTLLGRLLEKVGIISPLPSRWNADGSWNW